MSKYDSYALDNITDINMLLAALANCGYDRSKVEVHETAQPLFDVGGRMTHYLSGNQNQPDKAHVIIRRNNTGIGASNDVGFLHQDGKYKAIVSEWDKRNLRIKGASFVEAVDTEHGKLQADRSIKTLLTKTIPGYILAGLIDRHATVKTEVVGQQTYVRVLNA